MINRSPLHFVVYNKGYIKISKLYSSDCYRFNSKVNTRVILTAVENNNKNFGRYLHLKVLSICVVYGQAYLLILMVAQTKKIVKYGKK